MNYTSNLNLKKPESTDFYDVEDQNDNMDILDEEISDTETTMNNHIANTSNPHSVTKSQVGLGNVDNTADEDKTVKEAGKVTHELTMGSKTFDGSANVTLLKSDLGLGNVDNTADEDKTVKEAGKVTHELTMGSKTFDGSANVTLLKSDLGLGNVDNTADEDKPVSTAVNAALALKANLSLSVVGSSGVHNLRYYNNKLQYFNGSTWEDATASGGVLPVLRITTTSGATLSITDGSTTITGTSTGTDDIEVPNFGTWVITASYGGSTSTSTITVDVNKIYECTISFYHEWGVRIDQSNSNPESSVTYLGDAVGMTAGSSDWDDIFGYKPCLFINGAVSKYLNSNNFAQDEDGNSVDITTVGNDVMIEFPKMGYKISTSGNYVDIYITNNPNNSEYCYKPFSRNAIGDKDYFYYGAYKSYSADSKLYSSSGKTPTANKTRATYRSEATARGTGYFQNGWYQLIYIQCLYLLKYKNLNSQSALGYGYVGGSVAQTTGGANTEGMCYGNTSSQTDRLKLFGIEDFWGNIWSWVDGLTTDASRNLIVTHLPVNFDDATSGTAHTSYASGVSSSIGNYLSKVQGSTDTGFAAKEVSGSDSTYYCDVAFLYASCVAAFGSAWDNALRAGAFRLDVGNASSGSALAIASRLMYV